MRDSSDGFVAGPASELPVDEPMDEVPELSLARDGAIASLVPLPAIVPVLDAAPLISSALVGVARGGNWVLSTAPPGMLPGSGVLEINNCPSLSALFHRS